MTQINLENLYAVKSRVEEIRRRFVDPQETGAIHRTSGRPSFEEALQKAKFSKPIPCPAELNPIIERAAAKHGIDPAVIKSVIRAESGFRPDAVSRAGARGLMQLMPGTAQALGVDAFNVEQNIEGGTRYLKQQLDRFGSLELALAAYNAGPGNVTRYGGIPPFNETRNYVTQVLGNIPNYR